MLFLSKYRKADEADYCVYHPEKAGSKSYRGSQTNDAPVQYLYDSAVRDGKSVTKILCITTRDNTKANDDIGETTYERFCDYVNTIMPGCRVIPIRYDYIKREDDIIPLEVGANAQINGLYKQLSDQLIQGGAGIHKGFSREKLPEKSFGQSY